jgi:FkbM family methyltransferase
MSAPKLVEFEHGLSVYASSSIEARFLEEEFFRTDCYADISLPDRSLIVDAGANIGMFTLFVKLRYPDAEVLAFEPAPETAAILRQNIRLHELDGVAVHQVGLGATPSQDAPFTYYPALPGNSTRYPEQKASAKVALTRFYSARVAERLYQHRDLTVPVERLSTFLPADRPVDLLKVNVQGDELEVLLGIDPAHWPLIRQAIVKVQDHEGRLAVVCDLLRSHGLDPSAVPAPLLDDDLHTYLVRTVRRD